MDKRLTKLISEIIEVWRKPDGLFIDFEIWNAIDRVQQEEDTLIELAYEAMKSLPYEEIGEVSFKEMVQSCEYSSWRDLCYEILWASLKAEIFQKNPDIREADVTRLKEARESKYPFIP